MSKKITELLGDKAEFLLDHKSKTISKGQLHLPGPDFVDRIWINSDRSPQVLRNLQLMYGTGRSAYRILFFIRERMEHDSPVVRILHVRHGSQQPLGQHRIGNDEDDTTG